MNTKRSTRLSSSFGYAFNGIKYCFTAEQNFKIHVAASAGVIAFGFATTISSKEWIAVLICIMGVIALEMINTAIEKLCDKIHPGYDSQVKIIKDVSAGAVLIGAIISVCIGAIIFLPKLLIIFK